MEEIYFDKINSTQDYAKKLLFEGKRDFLVKANIQDKGRGRASRVWNSKEGGLWFSFDLDFYNAGELFTMAIGVGVRKVLIEEYGCDIKLKWPNDIFINGKKAGGILCERIGNRVIVGIGLNTNLEDPECENSITLFNVTGKRVDNNIIMKSIIEECKKILLTGVEEIIDIFRENMAFREEMCFVSSLGKEAKILDVTRAGHLMVLVDGEIKEIFTGEIVCI